MAKTTPSSPAPAPADPDVPQGTDAPAPTPDKPGLSAPAQGGSYTLAADGTFIRKKD